MVELESCSNPQKMWHVKIDRYGVFWANADTDILAIHELIANTDKLIFSKFLNVVFCFIKKI